MARTVEDTKKIVPVPSPYIHRLHQARAVPRGALNLTIAFLFDNLNLKFYQGSKEGNFDYGRLADPDGPNRRPKEKKSCAVPVGPCIHPNHLRRERHCPAQAVKVNVHIESNFDRGPNPTPRSGFNRFKSQHS